MKLRRKAVPPRSAVAMFVPSSRGGHPRYAAALLVEISRLWGGGVIYLGARDVDLPAELPGVEVKRLLEPVRLSETYGSRFAWAVSRFVFYTRRDVTLLRWLVSRRDVGILHLQDELAPWMMPLLFLVMRMRRQRVVATLHNTRPHASGSALSRARQRLAWLGLARAATIFVHEGVDRAFVARELHVPTARVVSIEHGLFEEECTPPDRNGRSILFFGSWRRNKGLHELIEAMRLLDGWRLSIRGKAVDASYASECLANAPSNVSVREGFVPEDEIASIFEAHSACVLPYTQFEAQSGVLHLALGAGRPVIVSPVGGMAHVVRTFGCGIVTRSTTPPDIAAAVRDLFEESFFDRACQGVKRAQVGLGWSRAAEQTVDAYRALLPRDSWRDGGLRAGAEHSASSRTIDGPDVVG